MTPKQLHFLTILNIHGEENIPIEMLEEIKRAFKTSAEKG